MEYQKPVTTGSRLTMNTTSISFRCSNQPLTPASYTAITPSALWDYRQMILCSWQVRNSQIWRRMNYRRQDFWPKIERIDRRYTTQVQWRTYPTAPRWIDQPHT